MSPIVSFPALPAWIAARKASRFSGLARRPTEPAPAVPALGDRPQTRAGADQIGRGVGRGDSGWIAWTLFGLAVLAVGHAVYLSCVAEDAYITFRFARRFGTTFS